MPKDTHAVFDDALILVLVKHFLHAHAAAGRWEHDRWEDVASAHEEFRFYTAGKNPALFAGRTTATRTRGHPKKYDAAIDIPIGHSSELSAHGHKFFVTPDTKRHIVEDYDALVKKLFTLMRHEHHVRILARAVSKTGDAVRKLCPACFENENNKRKKK